MYRSLLKKLRKLKKTKVDILGIKTSIFNTCFFNVNYSTTDSANIFKNQLTLMASLELIYMQVQIHLNV